MLAIHPEEINLNIDEDMIQKLRLTAGDNKVNTAGALISMSAFEPDMFGILEAGYTPNTLIAGLSVAKQVQSLYLERLVEWAVIADEIAYNALWFATPRPFAMAVIPYNACEPHELFLFDREYVDEQEAIAYRYNLSTYRGWMRKSRLRS